mmetsp:Transcript_14174/g.30031  ORF Transcript_14174/g.30031 Transcript_14174/m.30031 type:complete len:222 (+) Transcript_14174:198-863(+)
MPRTSQNEARTTRSAKRRLEFGDGDGAISSSKNNNDGELKRLMPVATAVPNALLLGSSTGTPDRKKWRGQEGIAGYFSSPSKTSSTAEESEAAVLVTPEKELEPIDRSSSSSTIGIGTHVPEHIHKNLDYQRRGQAVLSDATRNAFELIEKKYCGGNIPANFENDRRYGPLSGTCFEKRVIDAYDRGLIVSFSGVGAEPTPIICTHCASVGHGRDDCPQLI